MSPPPPFAITLEEHSAWPGLGGAPDAHSVLWKAFPGAKEELEDYSTGRIAEMDKGHISFQIMSHLPGSTSHNPEGCRKGNNEMAEAIRKHPDRFGGFAGIPMAYPEQAAAELERAVKKLGFLGALIDNHLNDMTHYDDERFWPVFEAAERLDVPLYFHPAPPPQNVVAGHYNGNYSPVVRYGLATAAWGWHQDIGLHMLKLYAAGVFTRFPRLKIIVGHLGEMLPLMLDRVQQLPFLHKDGSGTFDDIWNRNIWVTSSGMFSVRMLEMVLKVTKKDRVLYSIDTPFAKSIEGWTFMQELAEKGSLSKEELDMFAYGNAQKLFKLDVVLKEF
ncbi:amidohydrolase 2 [Hypomontagnella submonticulosa]|nr:amidohydrolase 2 [Hypomontagnella submonticulosa]